MTTGFFKCPIFGIFEKKDKQLKKDNLLPHKNISLKIWNFQIQMNEKIFYY